MVKWIENVWDYGMDGWGGWGVESDWAEPIPSSCAGNKVPFLLWWF